MYCKCQTALIYGIYFSRLTHLLGMITVDFHTTVYLETAATFMLFLILNTQPFYSLTFNGKQHCTFISRLLITMCIVRQFVWVWCEQTIFPMIPVPTCSAATSFMWFLCIFLTKITSIIPTSRMIRTCRHLKKILHYIFFLIFVIFVYHVYSLFKILKWKNLYV